MREPVERAKAKINYDKASNHKDYYFLSQDVQELLLWV